MMIISTCKTSKNSIKLQYRDIPSITLVTGKEWLPSEKELLQWSTSYPDTDLQRELRRIEDWFQKHPDRRKTERGMHTFVKVWLDQKNVAVLSGNAARITADIKTQLMISASGRNMISKNWKQIFCAYQTGQIQIKSTLTLDHHGPK